MMREPDTQYILSLSYGKDSLACLEAIKLLDYPLDRIIHAEVWATDTISADLPPMVEFKKHADRIIKRRYGIEVEHVCAMRNGEKHTYEKGFYRKKIARSYRAGSVTGFPYPAGGAWCSELKMCALKKNIKRNTIQYLGIAADEPKRIKRHSVSGKVLPLVDIGWSEAYCRKWCEDNDLLSPIYTDSARGGCWFCHNQGVEQLRLLRRKYPEYWALLLKWDADSPVSFKADGHTVHDYERRFKAEDDGIVPTDKTFKWRMIDDECFGHQISWEEL